MPLPPRVDRELPSLAERRTWTLDALDSLAEARGNRLAERGDSRFGTAYMILVAVVLVLAMGGALASRMVAHACVGAVCEGLGPASSSWLAASIVVGGSGALIVATRLVGPAGLSAARRSWFGSAPGDRALDLREPLASVALCGAVAGLAVGVAAAVAAGTGPSVGTLLLRGALTGVSIGVFLVLVAGWVQTTSAGRWWTAVGRGLLLLGIAGAAMAVGPWSLPVLPGVPAVVVGGIAVTTGALAAVLAAAVLPARLRRLPYAELRRGGDAAEAAVSSVLMLESGAIEDLRGARVRQTRGRFRSRPMRGHGDLAIVSADLRRLLRARTVVIVAVLLLPVAVVARSLLGPIGGTIVVALLAVLIGNGAASGLRLWTRSTSVRRMYPLPDVRVRVAHLVVPAVLAALWAALACALTGAGVLTWVCLSLSAAAAVLRTAPQVSSGIAAGQVQQSPMGAVPVGLMAVLLRGPDVAALPVLVALAGFPGGGAMLALAILLTFLTRVEKDRAL